MLNGATTFCQSFSLSKLSFFKEPLLQCYEVLWIDNIDAICIYSSEDQLANGKTKVADGSMSLHKSLIQKQNDMENGNIEPGEGNEAIESKNFSALSIWKESEGKNQGYIHVRKA